MSKTFISVDLETTGLVMNKHGIVQIGAWATGESEDHFKGYFLSDANPHWGVRGQREHRVAVEESALKVNGFTHERIEAAPKLYTVLHAFNAWVQRYRQDTEVVIVGQNIPFDVAWLKKDFYANGLDVGVFRRCIEVSSIGVLAYGELMGLSKMADLLGIKNGAAHDALSDAMTASKVFFRLGSVIRGVKVRGASFPSAPLNRDWRTDPRVDPRAGTWTGVVGSPHGSAVQCS